MSDQSNECTRGAERFRYALVGCGSQKRDCRNTLAYNLYTSSYFRKKRAYAQWCADFWTILSAKGPLPVIAYFEPYDLRLTKSGFEGEDAPNHDSVAEWAEDVVAAVSDTVHYHGGDVEIVVLAGRAYVDPLRDGLDELAGEWDDCIILYPFDDTSGIGEQQQWLDEEVAAERGSYPDEMNALFCDACERAARNAEVYPPGKVSSPGDGMAPEWWTAEGAWLCESCREKAKGNVEPPEVETPNPEGHPPDEIQSNLGRWSA